MISVKEPGDLLLPIMAACTLLDKLDYKSFHTKTDDDRICQLPM
jgi:hypothetical protein